MTFWKIQNLGHSQNSFSCEELLEDEGIGRNFLRPQRHDAKIAAEHLRDDRAKENRQRDAADNRQRLGPDINHLGDDLSKLFHSINLS